MLLVIELTAKSLGDFPTCMEPTTASMEPSITLTVGFSLPLVSLAT